MVQGNWKCSNCGTEITQLPFEPDGQRPVYCRDCHAQRRAERGR
ncbi:MAG: CxxC-x17-CxxC domain-containing protein [Candidatus Andersenbacteria bacterium]